MKNTNFLILFFVLLSCSTMAVAQTEQIRANETVKEQINESAWHYYEIDIDKPSKLTVKLRRISDDVDLYVSRTDKPTKESFLCAPKKAGKRIETCRLTSDTAGTWYVGVYGKLDSHYQLGVETKDMTLISQINDKLN